MDFYINVKGDKSPVHQQLDENVGRVANPSYAHYLQRRLLDETN
jgi:hypothetical protein